MDFDDIFGSTGTSTAENGSSLVDLLDSFLEMPVVIKKSPPKVTPEPKTRPKRNATKRITSPVPAAPKKSANKKIKKEPQIKPVEVSDGDDDGPVDNDNWQEHREPSEDEWPLQQEMTEPLESKIVVAKEEIFEITAYSTETIVNSNFQHLIEADMNMDLDDDQNHFNDFFGGNSSEGDTVDDTIAEQRQTFVQTLEQSKSLTCNFCEETFATADERFEHEMEIHVTEAFFGPYPDVEMKEQTLEYVEFVKKRAENWSVECCFCKKRFSTDLNRFKHEKQAHLQSMMDEVQFPDVDDTDFQCDYCGDKAKTRQGLKRHFVVHFPDLVIDQEADDPLLARRLKSKSLTCYFCQMKFSRAHRRLLHERTVHFGQLVQVQRDEDLYKCELCNFRSETTKAVQVHISRKHKMIGKYSIGPLTMTPEQREIEAQEAQQRKGLECKFCAKTFCDKFKRVIHELKTHLGVKRDVPEYAVLKDGKYHCRECPYAVHALVTLKKHYEGLHCPIKEDKMSMVVNITQDYQTEVFVETENEMKNVQLSIESTSLICEICDQKFDNRAPRVNHLLERHFETKWRCLYCTNLFTPKTNLKRHIEIAHGGVTKKRSAPDSNFCSTCGKYFKTMREVKMHEERVHLFKAYPKFKCPLCGVPKITDGEVRRHIRNRHPEQTVKCENCHSICFTTEELLAHKCVPGNVCDKCGMAFPNNKKMRRHQIKCKTEYQCTEPGCTSKFSMISGLNKHMRRHQWKRGEIEVAQCTYCGHRFFDKSHLASHIKTHRFLNNTS